MIIVFNLKNNEETMRKFKLLFAVLVSALLFVGCSVTSYPTKNVNLTQTNVVLQDNNFTIVKSVSAEASSSYFFGIGGVSKKALHDNAVANLTKEAGLVGSQALINVTVKSDTQFFFIWSKTTYRAYGTVIEFK